MFASRQRAGLKKILILTAGFGEGHNTAARALAESLKCVDPHADPVVIDLFKECYPRLFRITSKAYLIAINEAPKAWASIYRLLDLQHHRARLPRFRKLSKRLLELLAQTPFAIAVTYPAYPPLLRRVMDPLPCPLHTVVTDSITINHIWHVADADSFITANAQTSEVLINRGIAPTKVYTLGFPVSRRFAQIKRKELPDPTRDLRVVYAINSGRHRARNIVKRLLSLPALRLTVLAGRDERLRARLLAATEADRDRCDILPWTDEIPRILSEHHLLISKAGGATTQEAIAAGIPLIIHQIVPGQEAGNARLILENGWGFYAPRTAKLLSLIEHLRANGGELLKQAQDRIRAASRPMAADDIARFILNFPKAHSPSQGC